MRISLKSLLLITAVLILAGTFKNWSSFKAVASSAPSSNYIGTIPAQIYLGKTNEAKTSLQKKSVKCTATVIAPNLLIRRCSQNLNAK